MLAINRAIRKSHQAKNLASVLSRSFSQVDSETTTTTTETTDSEASSNIRNRIDPLTGQYNEFLKNVQVYEEQTEDILNTTYLLNMAQPLKGHATVDGTEQYYRMSQYADQGFDNLNVHHENFRGLFHQENMRLTSLGIGTYVGSPDDMTDYLMYEAIKQSVLSGGVNHIDTAPNYRYMKSEKTVGKVLTVLERKYDIDRQQLFIASKGGYVPEDGEEIVSRDTMMGRIMQEASVPEDAFQKESGHCMHPKFLEHQLNESLKRLNLECLDVYYLHNPYEAQGPHNTDNVFYDRLAKAFEYLEKAVQEGKIRDYGLATYSCFRVKPSEGKIHLNLQKVHDLARQVGGDSDHHFRYVQVPINLMMPEAFSEPWQQFIDKEGVERQKMLVNVASDLELNLISSQPLMQGLTSRIPMSREAVPGVYNICARQLQFLRSIPTKCLKSTLVGMKQTENVKANLEVVQKPQMTREEFFFTMSPHRRQPFIDDEMHF